MRAPMAELPLTIPQLVAQRAERFGDREAVVDGDVRLSFTEFADEIDTAARALIASGIEPGDRVAIWAPNIYEWAVAALATHSRRRRRHPAQHAVQGRGGGLRDRRGRSAGCCSPSPTSSTPTTSSCSATRRGPSRSRRSSCSAGAVPDGCTSWADFLGPRRCRRPGRVAARGPRPSARRPVRHPVHVGDDRRPEGCDALPLARASAPTTTWSDVVGLREGDRYLVINPFFHSFGLKAGILACLLKGATLVPHPIFDVPSVMRRVAEERITMLPGPPAIFQTILEPSRPRARTTCRRCDCR